jgi:hypothetical protein
LKKDYNKFIYCYYCGEAVAEKVPTGEYLMDREITKEKPFPNMLIKKNKIICVNCTDKTE